jgi:glycosyltransferase involved in cell wall biosynthesis
VKIAFVNNQFQLGGAETVVSQLRTGVVAAGSQADLYVAHGKTYPSGVHPLYPVSLSRVYHTRFHGMVESMAPRAKWTDTAFRRLAESDADLIHLHNFHADYATIESLACVASRKKLVWTLHALWAVTGGCDHPRDCRRYLENCGDCPQLGVWPVGDMDRTAAQLEEKLTLLADKPIHVVAPSLWLADIVRNSRVGRGWRVHHIANGVDPAEFMPRSRCGTGEVTVLIVNRNFSDPQKGFPIALKALELVDAGRVKIILAGQNGAWAASKIPRGFVVRDAGYVAHRSRLAELYKEADVFLFASQAENFPCVVLEAMAAECCVVATPTGGVVEQIEHERSGLLAGAIDGKSLSTVLQRALGDAELRAFLGGEARRRVSRHFPEKGMVDAYLKLYQEVIDKG